MAFAISFQFFMLSYQKIECLKNLISFTDNSCKNIKNIQVLGENIIIDYNVATVFPSFKNNFALITEAYGKQITFSPGSATIENITNKSLEIRFHMPFVQNYTCDLYCLSNSTFYSDNSAFYKMLSNFKRKIQLNITEFSKSKYSQLFCHGTDWRDRWCEGRNIIIHNRHIKFYSPANFVFPSPFLVLGARGYPFDKESDRLVFEPIVINEIINNLTFIPNFSFLYGIHPNNQMLWHSVYDFILPLKQFIDTYYSKISKSKILIFLKNNDLLAFIKDLISTITSHPINIIPPKSNFLFENLILGIEKPEGSDLLKKRNVTDSLLFNYNISRSTIQSFREEIFKFNNISSKNENSTNIIIMDRNSKHRKLTNSVELRNSIENSCNFCNVSIVHLEKLKFIDQIRLISRTDVLIGVHGSGLTHSLWMRNNSHLIEILPYKYNCRQWFKDLALNSNVNYHSVMNINQKNISSKIKDCLSRKDYCSDQYCHEYMKETDITLEIDTFNKIFNDILLKMQNKQYI